MTDLKFSFLRGNPNALLGEPRPNLIDIDEWNQRVPKLMESARDAGDDRSYALLSAMIVEHSVDRLHATWSPGWSNFLESARGFDFDSKLKLLRAYHLIPPITVDLADAIRGVRNSFAHELTIRTFDQVPTCKRDRLRHRIGEAYPSMGYDSLPVKDQVGHATYAAVIAVEFFIVSAAIARKVLKADLQGRLDQIAKTQWEASFAQWEQSVPDESGDAEPPGGGD